jgi:hypothetical protein
MRDPRVSATVAVRAAVWRAAWTSVGVSPRRYADLEGSRQRAHHPIPADYQQGDEGSRDGVDDHSLTIFRVGFLAISRHCYDCHVDLPKVDSIKIRSHYFCINKISDRYFGSSGNSVQEGSSLTRSAPLVANHILSFTDWSNRSGPFASIGPARWSVRHTRAGLRSTLRPPNRRGVRTTGGRGYGRRLRCDLARAAASMTAPRTRAATAASTSARPLWTARSQGPSRGQGA